MLQRIGAMTSGLAVLGVGSYVMLIAFNRTACEACVASFGAFWAISFGLVVGVFFPFEQLLARSVVRSAEGGAPDGPRVIRLYGVVCTLIVGCLLLTTGPVSGWLFHGDDVTVLALAGVVVGVWLQSYQRGVFAGRQRFDLYGRQLAADGIVRGIAGVALLLYDEPSAAAAAWLLVAAALASLCVTPWPRLDGPGSTSPDRWTTILGDAAAVSLANTIGLTVMNAGPVVVVAVGAGPGAAAAFAALFVIARIPLLFQGTLQSLVLPALTRLAVTRDRLAFGRQLWSTMRSVVAAGVLVVVVFGLLADVWLSVLYGSRFSVSPLTGTTLALSTALFLVGAAMQAGLVATGAGRSASVAWIVAAVVFAVAVGAVPGSPTARVVAAYATCSAALVVVQGGLMRSRLRQMSAGWAL